MKKILAVTGLTLGLVFTSLSQADERPQHFKGLPSPDLATALVNFAEYNQKLEAKLAGKLTDNDLAEIHQLTYTLENALGKISQELSELADTLEEVHVASETFDLERLTQNGATYLEVSKTLLQQN